jgi:4-hydroxy-3-methylbut-2-en-1-yl diphosphate synthase IspG/GcpE
MAKVAKKPLRKNLIKELDTVFSKYIRLRYAKNEIAECVTCGKKQHWKKLQAGHFMSRTHYSTRWDEDNVQVQCVGCNVYHSGEQYKYSLYLGNKLSEELYLKSKQIVKFADVELIDMIDYYKQQVNILHKFT